MTKFNKPIIDIVSGVERDPLSLSYGKQVWFRTKSPGDKTGDLIYLWKKPVVIEIRLKELSEETKEKLKGVSDNIAGVVTVDDPVKCTEDKVVDGKRFVYVICKAYDKKQEGWIWENQLTNYGKESKDGKK